MNPERSKQIRSAVLDSIANDYEEFATVVSDLQEWLPDLRVTNQELVSELETLIQDGLVKAYVLTEVAREVPFLTEQVNELWFYITPTGLDAL